jgi:hypothetical protein
VSSVALKQLWEVIPEATREKALQTLARLVAQQLQTPPSEKEACDEDS